MVLFAAPLALGEDVLLSGGNAMILVSGCAWLLVALVAVAATVALLVLELHMGWVGVFVVATAFRTVTTEYTTRRRRGLRALVLLAFWWVVVDGSVVVVVLEAECVESAAAEAIMVVVAVVILAVSRVRSIFATELSVIAVLLLLLGGMSFMISGSTSALATSSCNCTPNDASVACCTKTIGCVTI
jgi:hypothetical protein